jgi:hypothetical protein
LAFDFFGDRGDGITDLGDDPMQIVARNAKPPFQDSDLAGISHVYFIASGQRFSVAHVMQLRRYNLIASQILRSALGTTQQAGPIRALGPAEIDGNDPKRTLKRLFIWKSRRAFGNSIA